MGHWQMVNSGSTGFPFYSERYWVGEEKPPDWEDGDPQGPYDAKGNLRPGWDKVDTRYERGFVRHTLHKTVDEDGNPIWMDSKTAAPGYKSIGQPNSNQWVGNLVDVVGSIAAPPFAIASGLAKVIKGGYEGNWGSVAGGAVQGIGGAYASGAFGGASSGAGDAFAATQAADDASMTGWQTISPSDYAATAAGEDWSMGGDGSSLGDNAWNLAKNQAKNYAKNLALKTLAGSEESGGQSQRRGFMIEDSPLADVFKDKEDSLDKIFKMTGETGDIGTAMEAAKAFEMTTVQGAELEKEIVKYSGDPDYKAIEPEIRATTMEAIQKGMSPKQATAYAFEKAKKERAFSDFLTDFKMRKKLELAGMSEDISNVSWKDKVGISKNRGYKGQEKVWPNQAEGVNSPVREFIPQYDNDPNDPMLYDPVEIGKFRERFRKQGVSL